MLNYCNLFFITRHTNLSLITSIRILLVSISMLVWSANAVAVPDPSIRMLKSEVAELKLRVEELEKQLTTVLNVIANKKPEPDTTGIGTTVHQAEKANTIAMDTESLQVKAGPTVVVGGRIKADAIYNSRSVGGPSGNNRADLIFTPAAIPLNGEGEDNQVSFSGRETRLWVTAHTPTAFGDLGAYVEFDMLSSESTANEKVSNSYTPRMRHAYGTFAGFTAGQTYTTFLNVSAYPELNDADGPLGITNVRLPLLRYKSSQDWGAWYFALEQPESTLTTVSGSSIAPDDDRVPDIIGKVEISNTWGNWSLAGMLREIRSDGAVVSGHEDSEWGGAISASGRIHTFGLDNIRFALNYGNTLGRYLSFNAFDDGVIDSNGDIRLTEVAGGYLSYQHWWTDTIRSNFTVGYAEADNDLSLVPDDVDESFFSSHLNMLWSPTSKASIGIEWLYGRRQLEDGREGNLNRIQLTSIYKF